MNRFHLIHKYGQRRRTRQWPRQWAGLVMRNILNNDVVDVDLLPLLLLLLLSSSAAIVVAVNCHAY